MEEDTINVHQISIQTWNSENTYCFAEYEQWTLYGALVVTLAMLLRLIDRRFIVIIIIIIIILLLYDNCWKRKVDFWVHQ